MLCQVFMETVFARVFCDCPHGGDLWSSWRKWKKGRLTSWQKWTHNFLKNFLKEMTKLVRCYFYMLVLQLSFPSLTSIICNHLAAFHPVWAAERGGGDLSGGGGGTLDVAYNLYGYFKHGMGVCNLPHRHVLSIRERKEGVGWVLHHTQGGGVPGKES